MVFAHRFGRVRWLLVFAAYLAVVAFLYRDTVHSKFLYDWNTWMLHYMTKDMGGFAQAYGDGAMRWGYHLGNVVLWKLFGFNATGWFLAFVAVHAFNGVLLSVLVRHLLRAFQVRHARSVAIMAGLVWLVSPYHSEPVVWGATFLYLTSTTLILAGTLFFLRSSVSHRTFNLGFTFICFVCALLTHEGALVFPFMLLVLWLLQRTPRHPHIHARPFLVSVFVPMLGIVALYFIANQLRVGSWVGHYGEASHLNTDLGLIVPNLSKYMLELLYVPLFFTFGQRDAVYAMLETDVMVWVHLAVGIALATLVAWKLVRGNPSWRLTSAFLALAVMALLPVINLYFMYFKDIEQDRYMYMPSAFFYAFLVLALIFTLRRFAVVPIAVCLAISILFLHRHNNNWALSGHIANGLLEDFRWEQAPRVFVLLTPDNVNGAYCMRSMPGSSLAEMLAVQRDMPMTDRIFEVYQWNVVTGHDSASVHVVDSGTLRLELHAPGAWLWRNSFGAADVETDLFSARPASHFPGFTVTFKDKQPGDVFIYAINDHWKQVEF